MENITRVIGNQILDWQQCQGLINNKRNLLMGRQVVRDAVMVRDVSWEEAEDGIRDVERSRGLGDVYKRQICSLRLVCLTSFMTKVTMCSTSPASLVLL